MREGYLFGATKKGAWRKRYIVLLEDRLRCHFFSPARFALHVFGSLKKLPTLRYYKKRRDSTCEGEVLLPGGAYVARSSEANCIFVASTGDEDERGYGCLGLVGGT